MRVTKPPSRIIREESGELPSEQDHTTHINEPVIVEPVETITSAAESFADAIAGALPATEGTLDPELCATIIPTIMEALAQRGVNVA